MRMNGGISMRENAWKKYDEKQLEEIFAYCEGYKKYISDCKTERECTTEGIRIAESYGYRNLEDVIKNNETLKAGRCGIVFDWKRANGKWIQYFRGTY